ncbi:hypothetical protein [Lacunisphaera limnophila]|uniref:hypothetical protein n=1 Tax=Lacunisphaera limnophila TaxID=1838286 RepID=UPI001471AEB3|nr:hypothetical protein [Lacunisphaera limnophila]
MESRLALAVFVVGLVFHAWGMTVGWTSRNLPGGEFRQAQTALSTHWIKAEQNFALAYPTPVLGKPWSLPMEFPLYQWTVVKVSEVTHWSLTKAGRAVSIACFYLLLPAVFLLLRRWQVAPAHRWLVLAVVVTCPLYIFYTRAFLIETMALMASLWFWVAFERAVGDRSKVWLAVAVIAGTGAGLVKVTTFMLYLLPAGVWALARLWAARRQGWKTELAWMAAAVAVPFGATLWWLDFADATKALNPLGTFLTSANLKEFNFGTLAIRLSPEAWATKARIVREALTWLPAMLVCLLLLPFAARARWRPVAACGLWFASVLVIFPVLYEHHEYYYVANTLLLLLAMGLVLVAVLESRVARWVAYGAVAVVLIGQGGRYLAWYYPVQRAISPGGDGLTTSLRTLTNPGDVILVLGQDWNSMTAYYAQRRAIMFRNDVARDGARVEQALADLGSDKIGALIIVGEPDGAQWLIDRAAARGLGPEPLYVWRDARVFVPQARRTELLHSLLENDFHEVALAPGVEPPRASLAGKWFEMAAIHRWQRKPFVGFQPAPVRFFASFGPAMDGSSGQPMYGAHPVTRLVFALPAGQHTLRSALQMSVDAYRLDLTDAETTDGVEVSLFRLGPGEERTQIGTRHFDPRHNREDRGNLRPLEFTFTLEAAGEVELFFGPGPAGKDTRDWIELGPVRIE